MGSLPSAWSRPSANRGWLPTKSDPRLLRLFGNRTLKYYDAFADFYGMEGGIIEEIVAFYRHAAQGLEERKQVLYLLGPVGSAKSTLAIKLKRLMERYPIYTLVDGDTGERSPLLESPLGLFNPEKFGARLEGEYGIAAALSHRTRRAPGRRSACIATTAT